MAKNIAVALCIFLLLALFIFPHKRIDRICEGIGLAADHAIAYVHAKDFQNAERAAAQMETLFCENSDFLYLILQHQGVRELETAIKSAAQLIGVKDTAQTLMVLETITVLARHMREVERLSLLTVC